MSDTELTPSRAQQELEILYRISQALTQQHNVSALVNEVMDIMESDMGLSGGTLTLRRPGTDLFMVEAARGLSSEEVAKGQYELGDGITGRVAESGEPEIVVDISDDPDFLNRMGRRDVHSGAMAFMCVPIKHQQRVIGTMSMLRPTADEATLDRDLRFLRLVGSILVEAVAAIREQHRERASLVAENRRLRRQLGDRYKPSNIVGNSSSMRRVYEQIAQVADSPATVLVRGDSGTGKELVANAIHYSSSRRDNPFVCVNCAALPESLIESELFGHEKGSFTGANSQRKGRFELANGGTLFLDEIGDISPAVQVRLLRVLQERTFERVGGTESVHVNVRIIAATSRNLESYMDDGKFREDLYYRLNVFPIHMPSLKDRRADILLLADFFIRRYNELYGKVVKRISTTAINMIMAYHWPGNVRELENCIERSVLTSTDDVIHGYSLPPSLQTGDQTNTAVFISEGVSLKELVRTYEREIIVDSLKKHRGNATAAARQMHTTQRIMNYRIQQLGIDPGTYR